MLRDYFYHFARRYHLEGIVYVMTETRSHQRFMTSSLFSCLALFLAHRHSSTFLHHDSTIAVSGLLFLPIGISLAIVIMLQRYIDYTVTWICFLIAVYSYLSVCLFVCLSS